MDGRITRVAADAPDQFDRKIPKGPDKAVHVVSGICDDHDVRLASLPLARRDEPFNHTAELSGGTAVASSTGPRRTASRICIQDVAPISSTATSEYTAIRG